MDKVKIRWLDSQHTGDDFEQIIQSMEVGDDEGPIILLPVRQRGRNSNNASARYPAQLFKNPLWLGAHLVEYADDLNHEFWLGVCEASPKAITDVATSGLWYFKELLNDLGGMNRRTRFKKSAREEAEKFASMTGSAEPVPPMTAVDILIENTGEAFEDIAHAFSELPRSIMISRA